MIIKNLFFNIYLLLFNINTYVYISLVSISLWFIINSLRKKFIIFIFLLIIYSIWGFLFNLDGMMLILLTTEFTLILLFLMTYIQLYSNFQFFKLKYYNCGYLFFFIFYFSNVFQINLYYQSFYNSISHIITSDFFILYYFLFEKCSLIIIIFTLIISLFSLFFIILYYNLKIIKNIFIKNNKQIQFLRKQTLLKQTKFNTKLYTFQI